MKIVSVVYSPKKGFAGQNQANIKKVMADLQKLNRPGINYHCCLSPDGNTFRHTAFFKSEEDHQVLNKLDSFIYFQEQLKAAGFEASPKQELLSLVGASKDLFMPGAILNK